MYIHTKVRVGYNLNIIFCFHDTPCDAQTKVIWTNYLLILISSSLFVLALQSLPSYRALRQVSPPSHVHCHYGYNSQWLLDGSLATLLRRPDEPWY